MALILNIETATRTCSVALSSETSILAFEELTEQKFTHAENLTLFIEKVMKEAGKELQDLDAVAVSKGPGSYTGLRIGVSSAKGICYALSIPLIGINSLEGMVAGVLRTKTQRYSSIVPMFDARRMEVYTAVFNGKGKKFEDTRAQILDEQAFTSLLDKGKVLFVGDGANKFRELTNHPNACFDNGFFPSATYFSGLALSAFLREDFEDVAYFEPFYLKNFS